MSDQISNNKRIAKNTVFLYCRMLLMLFISFFTSRVILQSLGVVDYGIYNVVGGIVSLFTFFNTALSSATGRFLSYEIGKENEVVSEGLLVEEGEEKNHGVRKK